MPRFDAFIGASYESQAVTADEEDLWNWYPEALQSPGATAKTALYPTPGVKAISEEIAGSGRAHFAQAGREFAVIGTRFVEIAENGTVTDQTGMGVGDLAINSNPATISSNGDAGGQLFITSGGEGYIFDLSSNTLTNVAALSQQADQGDYLDGYFLALDFGTSTLFISALLDGTSWNTAEDFAQRSLASDPWRAMKVTGRYIWLLGEYTTEIWQDTGANFPFAPFPSSLLSYGIAAPFSPAIIENDLVWLAQTRSGRRCIVRGTGVTPDVVSTYPLESALQDYTGIELAVGDSYSDRGHSFYLIGFDHDSVTWAFDATTKLWHKRGTWQSKLNRFSTWRPRYYALAFGEHRILDSQGGLVYRMSTDALTDVAGLAIRRVRRAPAIMDENKRIYYSYLEIVLDSGLGTTHPPTVTGVVAKMTWLQVAENTHVAFDATGSTGAGTLNYSWDMGDGSFKSGSIIDESFPYPPDQTWTVTLTVTDETGAKGTVTAAVTTNWASGMSGSATGSPLAPFGPGIAPQVMLRLSNDGGKTWISEQWRSAGDLGEYNKRVRWNRLGAARRRVFEVSVTDAVPWRITGCFLDTMPSAPSRAG